MPLRRGMKGRGERIGWGGCDGVVICSSEQYTMAPGSPLRRLPGVMNVPFCASVAGVDRIEAWPSALAVGQPLPTVPLSLEAEHCVPVNLEAAYAEACQRRRVDEVLG